MADEDKGFNFMGLFKDILKEIFSSKLKDKISGLKNDVKDTVDYVEERAKIMAENFVKNTVIFVFIFTGAIFILVGLGKYLSKTVPVLRYGLGFVVVGVLLLILGLFSKWFSN